MVKPKIEIPKEEILEFCLRWRVTEFALFGSVLRSDFNSNSDIDVLVTFSPDANWTLFDMVKMQDELEDIFGRQVDLVSRRGVETSRNFIRKREILESAEVVHAAG